MTNIYVNGGEVDEEKVRNDLDEWLEKHKEMWYRDGGCVHINDDQDEVVIIHRRLCEHAKRKYEEAEWDDLWNGDHSDDVRSVVSDVLSGNSDLSEKFMEEMEGKDSQTEGGGEGGTENTDEKELGESHYPELGEVGVVDESGNVVRPKFRGLFLAFIEKSNVIVGTSDEWTEGWVARSFVNWCLNEFGSEIITLLEDYEDEDLIGDAIETVIEKQDGIESEIEDMYVGGANLSVDGPDPGSVHKEHIDNEDEDNDKEDLRPSERKWKEYEEQSDSGGSRHAGSGDDGGDGDSGDGGDESGGDVRDRGISDWGSDASHDERVGSPEYGKLHEIGVIDVNKNPNVDKLRGTVLAFLRDVEEVIGKRDGPNPDELKQAWQRWMLNKYGQQWVNYTMDKMSPSMLRDIVEQTLERSDEASGLAEEKWVVDATVMEGNSPPDDLEGFENEVFNEDSAIVADWMVGDRSAMIDAIITDPPYGLNYDSRKAGGDNTIENDETVSAAMKTIRDVFGKAKISLNRPAPVLVFAGDENVAEVTQLMKDMFEFEQILVWDKETIGLGATGEGDSRAPRWRPKKEFAVYGGYGTLGYQNPNRHDGDVIRLQKLSHTDMDHPTQKPLELMEYVIESVTDEGDLVFDPFAGSGSTLVAAKRCNRKYLGCEMDEEHYETIMDRLKQPGITEYV